MIGDGVLGSDELDLAKTYIDSMERLQHEKEAGVHKSRSRLSVDDLLTTQGRNDRG